MAAASIAACVNAIPQGIGEHLLFRDEEGRPLKSRLPQAEACPVHLILFGGQEEGAG